MVSVRSLTSLRSSASKSRTGSAGVRSTGSPKRRMGLTLTASFYRSGHLGRVKLNPDGAAVLARAAGGLDRVQGPGQLEAVTPADPDQRAFPRFRGNARPGIDRHPTQYLGLGGQAVPGRGQPTDESRDLLGRAGDRGHPYRGREAELGAFGQLAL